MKWLITHKLLLASQPGQVAIVDNVYEGDNVAVHDGALIVFKEVEVDNRLDFKPTHIFPPTWWFNVQPAPEDALVDNTASEAPLVRLD